MTLQVDSWAVSGAQSSARIARLQLQSGTASGSGVVNSDHLQVLELAVPGTSVRITSGGATVLGAEMEFQGSYFAFNVGDAELEIAATGSGAGRSDLVVLRVEDPNIDGTSWSHDVTSDPVYYFRVIEGVSGSATQVPAGMTAIPLARIDVPASTATITQDMITDVRVPANPKSQRVLRVQRGGTQTSGEWDEAGNPAGQAPNFERWPQHDWTVTIPAWATQVQVLAEWTNTFLKPTGETDGTQDARGELWIGLVGTETITTTPSAYNFNQTSGTNGYRCSTSNKDQIDIPEALRGATVDVRMYCQGTPDQDGRLVADNFANFSVDLEFLEVAAPEAQL